MTSETTTRPSDVAAPMHAPNPATGSIPGSVRNLLLVLALSLTPVLAGCALKSDVKESGEFFKKIFRKDTYTLYRPDIQQGNAIDPKKIAQLELGMSKEQVRYLLGNPVADNVFHKNRWIYTYYLIPGKGERRRYRLALFFSEERLHKIRKSKEIAELTRKLRKENKARRDKRKTQELGKN